MIAHSSFLAHLAEVAGLLPCAQDGFTTQQGRPVDLVALGWFMTGAYGFDVPEDEAKRVLDCGRLQALKRQHARRIVQIEQAVREIDRAVPSMINVARYELARSQRAA